MRIKVQMKLALSGLAMLAALTIAGCGSGSSSTSNLSTAMPTFSPGAGAYNTSQTVTISDSTTGAVLYCTTDGTTPTTSSPKCSQPTTVYQTEFLQAIAVVAGGSPSAVASAAYTVNLGAAATPTFSPAGGIYTAPQTVTLADATSGANIFYTTDGTTPTASSTLYTAPILVSATETVNAIAVASGFSNSGIATATYGIISPIATPAFSSPSGSYPTAQTISITDATANAVIYYTTDGTTPTAASTAYTAPISVTTSETISAIAILADQSSQVAVASYVIGQVDTSVAAPTFSLAAGTYSSAQTVTLADTTDNATIYYTTDGSTPTASSTAYAGAISVTTSETISAIAIAAGVSSPVVTATYTIALPVASPAFSVPSGTYTTAQTVTITDATAGATIYYTLDGSIPTSSSTAYTAPITVSTTETISAIAILGSSSSPVVAAAYNLAAPIIATPAFSVPSGTYVSTQTVTITDATAGAAIYYTLDSTIPTLSSTLYTAPIVVTQTQILTAIAVAGANASPVATAAYVIGTTVPAPTFNPVTASTVAMGQTVTIIDSDHAAAIYYSTDGSTPSATSTTSTKYTAPVAFTTTGTATFEAVAIDGTISSPVSTATYTVKAPTPPPTFTPAAGSPVIAGATTVTIADTDTAATIYYSLDGSTPTAASTKYTAAFTLPSAGSVTVNAIAIDTGLASTVATVTYTVSPASVPAPTFTPPDGTALTAGQTVTIADTDTNALIYYTLDGSTPSATSTQYTSPIALTATGAVKAIAIDGATSSTVAVASYTVASGPSISVTVLSGTLPVVGASVQIYAAGVATGDAGYGSAATAVGAAGTTNASGVVSIPVICPTTPGSGALVYVVATGGDASGSGASNTGLEMMTALGLCANVGTSYTVNEATTVASAYALSAFMTTAPNVGSSTANYAVGLGNAFATVNNLVNVTTGTVLTFTPAYPTNLAGDPNILNNSTVPTARINTLANMLNSCTATDGSGCSALFTAAAPPAGAAPTDTLQAALDIAQNPGANATNLFALGASGSFTPILAGAPNDWTLALTFTGGGLGIAPNTTATFTNYEGDSFAAQAIEMVNTSLAIDAAGNVWVTAYGEMAPATPTPSFGVEPMLAEFNNLGKPLTAITQLSGGNLAFGGYQPGATTGGGSLLSSALDLTGNIWTGDNDGTLFVTTPGLAPGPLNSIMTGGASVDSVAIDGSNNIWSAQQGLYEFSGVDGSQTLLGTVVPDPTYLAFDSGGGLWLGVNSVSSGAGNIFQVNLVDGSIAFTGAGGSFDITLAADGTGHIYACDASATAVDVFKGTAMTNSFTPSTNRGCGNQLALDGMGHLFAISNMNPFGPPITAVDEFTLAGAALSGGNGYTGTSTGEGQTLNPDFNFFPSTLIPGVTAAVDASGNLWAINDDTSGFDGVMAHPGNVLVEFIGISAPVVTPTSVALKNGQLGSRP